MIGARIENPSYTLDEIIGAYQEIMQETGLSHGCPFGEDFDNFRFEGEALRVIKVSKQYLKEHEPY
jgi:hypothetical protein